MGNGVISDAALEAWRPLRVPEECLVLNEATVVRREGDPVEVLWLCMLLAGWGGVGLWGGDVGLYRRMLL